MAGLLLGASALGDRIGHKRMYLGCGQDKGKTRHELILKS
jgi:hypothetical protein